MLFENIIKILDKSKSETLDISVASRKLVSEGNGADEEISLAEEFIKKYYKTITKCRRLGDNDTIKALVDADENGIKAIIEEVADRVEK